MLFKRILNLMVAKAPLNQYYLEIGTYFLKKGAGFQVGQIIKEKKLEHNLYRVSVITGLFYDFKNNKVNHTSEKRVMKIDEKAR